MMMLFVETGHAPSLQHRHVEPKAKHPILKRILRFAQNDGNLKRILCSAWNDDVEYYSNSVLTILEHANPSP